MTRFNKAKWALKYAEVLTPENAYFDAESGQTMYRGAGYCICCHRPMMEKGQRCEPCTTDDPCAKGQPLIVNLDEIQPQWAVSPPKH